MTKQKIVIVGGGFGGVKAALELSKDDVFDITIINNHDDFQYYPSLYRTATGGVPAESSIPLKNVFAGKHLTIMLDEATKIDRQKKLVHTKHGLHAEYDILILALGVVTNYFGIEGLEKYSYGIKSQDDIRKFKKHIHDELTNNHEPDPNYVIVGGGPTGIELAGALPEYLRRVMKNHGIKPSALHIDLIEAMPNLVPKLPLDVSQAIAKHLRRLGVRLYLGTAVQGETADALMINNQPLATHTVIWTAGVTNHPFFKKNNFALTDSGKVVVDKYLQAEPNIYVLGDNADTEFSGMAQTALRDAIFVAKNIERAASSQPVIAYKSVKPVYVIPAGPQWSAVYWHGIRFYGWLGTALRATADWVGYHDLEPWWQASKEWLTTFDTEEDCPVCAKMQTK